MRRGLNNEAPPVSNGMVSVVIPNRDGGVALDRCLQTARAQTGVPVEILVVDNGSSEEERSRVALAFPDVRLVAFSTNLGYSSAMNEGIVRTNGEFVLALNNDARIAPDYAARLAARLRGDAGLAAAQGLVLREDGAVDTAGLDWNGRGEAVPLWAGRPGGEIRGENVEIAGVSATASLYRRTALDAVAGPNGVFDDCFFAYYEDVDLSLRLARGGWRFLLDPGAVAWHEGSRTGARTPWRRALWTARNRWRTLLKNFDRGFLRRRLGSLLRADLAHARALGPAGAALPLLVWPFALARAALERPSGPLLTRFPAALGSPH